MSQQSVTSKDGTAIACWCSGEGPPLVLSGGDSPAALREAVVEALAKSRIIVMPGHGHAAMDTGTELFTTEVLRFVEDP